MEPLRVLIILLLVATPVLWYLWREARGKKPEVLWPRLAGPLELQYSSTPPSLRGSWRGREAAVLSESGRVVASVRFSAAAMVRIEIGEREQIERSSGMVVPDRVEFPEDPEFSGRLLVRATPEESGRLAADPAIRRRLAALEGVYLLASGGRVDVSVPAAKESELREILDIAAAVADSVEG